MKLALYFSLIFLTLAFELAACKTVTPHSAASSLNTDDNDSTLHQMTIEAPFKQLIYIRKQDVFNPEKITLDAPYVKASITYGGKAFDASVRLRGGLSFCGAFPQLKLKLPKDRLISGIKEFKIITHGTYPLDPAIPVVAPICGNVLADNNDQPRENAAENVLYDLSAQLLDTHLKNLKFKTRYLDRSNGIDVTDNAYYIEGADDAAKRYRMKPAVFPHAVTALSWSVGTEEEQVDSIAFELMISDIKAEYSRLKLIKPVLEESVISEKIEAFINKNDEEGEFVKRAKAGRADFMQKLKMDQIAILKRFDQASLIQTILFDTMVIGQDWNVFGITDHSDPVKNIEVFEDEGGKLFVAPYDFDMMSWALENFTGDSKSYDPGFKVVKGMMSGDLEAIVRTPMKIHGPEFLRRIEVLQKSGKLHPSLENKMAVFIPALRNFLKDL